MERNDKYRGILLTLLKGIVITFVILGLLIQSTIQSSCIHMEATLGKTKTEQTKLDSISPLSQKEFLDRALVDLQPQKEDLTSLDGVNVKNFKCADGKLVKGDGVHDDTTGIQAAIDAAYASITKAAKNVTVIFPAGTYKITRKLTMSSQCHLVSRGVVEINDYGKDSETLLITPKANDIPYHQELFFQPAVSGSFRFNNCTESKATKKSGIRIHSSNGAVDVNCSFEGIFFTDYYICIFCEAVNTYIMDFRNIRFTDSTIGFQHGDGKTEINSGEKLSIRDSVFTNCNVCINIGSSADLFFYNTAFDFNYCVVYGESKAPQTISFIGCWIEGVGYNYNSGTGSDGNWNGFAGIIKVPDTAEWYVNTYAYFTNTRIMHSHAKYQAPYFSGSSLSVNMVNSSIWFDSTVYEDQTATGDTTKAFLCDDTVRYFDMKDCDQTLAVAPWPQSRMSVIDPYFKHDASAVLSKDVGDVGLTEYTLDTIHEVGKWEVATVDGKQCIGLTSPWAGSTTYVWLVSKKKYRIKGEKFNATAFIKGYKGKDHSYAVFNLIFYDADDKLISDAYISDTYRVDDVKKIAVPSNKWIFPYVNRTFVDIPPNALYYKIKVQLIANSGSSNLNEVYFSGIHVFNY